MKNLRYLLAAIAAVLLASSAYAADPSGTWKWTQQGRDGQSFEQTLKLEYKDEKLTGAMAAAQGPRGPIPETPIGDATFKDDTVAFSVTREFNGNKIVTKYEGKLDGDTIKGASERPSMDGGAPRKRDWNATRQK